MSLRALKTLVAIAEAGSFASAARSLNLSQSAISTQMRGLEDELAVALFDRAKRPPVLNEAGKALVTKARELLAGYADLQNSLAAKGAIEGRIRLGAVGTTLTGILPVVLAVIRERYPSLHIEIVSGFSEELVQQISSRALDAAIVSDYEAKRQDLSWRPFLSEPLIMIAPPDARDTNPRRLAQTYPFIRYSPTAPVGRIIDRALRRANLQVRETMQLDWLEAIEAMVHHGQGIALVPERRFPAEPVFRVKRIPFGPEPFQRTLGIVEPVASPKRRLTDVLFAELTALLARTGEPTRQVRRTKRSGRSGSSRPGGRRPA
jgi:DNA-binding transcriptional LysR family regulator